MDQTTLPEKASAITGYIGVGTAVGSGVSVKVTQIWGLTTDEWQLVGIIGGLAVGFLSLFVNAALTAYFNWRRLQAELERAKGKDDDSARCDQPQRH